MTEITIRLEKKVAERLSFGLSDVACWMSGYLSALEDHAHAPLGMEAVRDMNIALKGALDRADRDAETEEIFG